MGWFGFFKREKTLESSFDFAELERSFHTLYLKGLAVDKSAEFLARICAISEFRHVKQGKEVDSRWAYLLNVRPNLDDTASLFWQKVVYRLLVENEVLIVLSDDDQLLMADSYVRKEYALYDDVFESVVVKNYTFKRSFAMSDVIFLQYNNNRLQQYVDGLFEDYQRLYHRLLEAMARNHQIRAVVKTKVNNRFDDEQVKKLQTYADGLFKSFSNKSIAIVPMMDGLDYEELTNRTGLGSISVDELKSVKRQFDDDIADILGIPSAILHGDMANLDSNEKALKRYCLPTLNKKIEDELNAKIIDRASFQAGEKIKVIGAERPNIFDLAVNIDKLIASGTFNRNEVREQLDYEPIENGDVFYMTKNYEEDSGEKGGEVENGNN